MFNLDEAIKHCEEVADEKENEAQELEYSKLNWKHEANLCKECASEHRQLAEWLKDYKRLKEQKLSRNMEEIEEIINCDADAETKCKMIFNILTAKPHYFEESTVTPINISGDMVCPQVDGVTPTVISNDDSYYKFVKNYNDTLPPNVHIMEIELGKEKA